MFNEDDPWNGHSLLKGRQNVIDTSTHVSDFNDVFEVDEEDNLEEEYLDYE